MAFDYNCVSLHHIFVSVILHECKHEYYNTDMREMRTIKAINQKSGKIIIHNACYRVLISKKNCYLPHLKTEKKSIMI